MLQFVLGVFVGGIVGFGVCIVCAVCGVGRTNNTQTRCQEENGDKNADK